MSRVCVQIYDTEGFHQRRKAELLVRDGQCLVLSLQNPHLSFYGRLEGRESSEVFA